MKFVHTADWQLGMTRHFLSEEAQARFGQARIDVIGTIGALAAAEGAAFVVVAGDVFESNFVERRVVVRALEAMGVCAVPFFLLPGNHDCLDASSVYRSATFVQHRPVNVHLLDGSEPVAAMPGVEVIGAPWRTKAPLTDLVGAAVDRLAAPPHRTLRVVVGHGGVDARSPAAHHPSLIRLAPLEAAITAGLVHYVALGDRHSTTAEGSSGRVWHAGAAEPTDYDETDPGNALVVELDEGRCSVTPKRVGTWRFRREMFDVTGEADVDLVGRWLHDCADKDRTVVKLALVGALALRHHTALTALLDHHRDLFAAIEDWPGHTDLRIRPDDHDFADLGNLGLVGYARDALDELRAAAAAGGPEGAVAGEALALLFRLGSSAA